MEYNNILIVEDDSEWIENYRRWLSQDTFNIDESSSSSIALEKLRTKYYSLLILDLSLDPDNPGNRDSIDVQEYLQRHPEGTLHIVSSAHAEKEDVRKAAFKYKSIDVFFKNEFEDPTRFINAVRTGIIKSNKERPNFIKQSYEKIVGEEKFYLFEHKMLKPLKPGDGAKGYIDFMDNLLELISPLELHKTRSDIAIVDDQFVFGIYWSRLLGSAISVCLTNAKTDDTVKRKAMGKWLGWDPGKK